jgi:hypothetical protein
VPGWWVANKDTDFYADVSVFRPKRVLRTLEKPYTVEEIDPLA